MNFIVKLKGLYVRKNLILELTKRELKDRHAGQTLGIFWVYAHPLFLMLVYTFLFAYVFPARFGDETGFQDFSVSVIAGILPWLAFQDILSRAPTLISSHSNLVKQIVFPIQVLPVKVALASALPYIVGVVFLFLYSAWHSSLSWFSITIVWVILWQIVAMIGMSFLISSIGVFIRDLKDFIQVFLTMNLFAQPILYNPFLVPDWMNWIFIFNPFSYIVWSWQDVFFHGSFYNPWAWIFLPFGSIAVLIIGLLVFDKTKHSYGDML